MHLEQLLAYLAGPAFAIAWAMIVADLFRNFTIKQWVGLDPSLKQLTIAVLTVVVPPLVASLIAGIPVETIKAADLWFYPIAFILGKIWFIYRKGQEVKPTTPVEEVLLRDLFGGSLPAKDS